MKACCKSPETIKTLYESKHEIWAVRQCRECGQYWLYQYHEYDTFTDGDGTTWYTLLTKSEAEKLLKEKPDLSFLKDKKSYMEDCSGMRIVKGAPTEPWW